ncbi:hypothetical protein B0T22DRAFT_266441 [Podospora appendiculata]|uniref:Chromatin modification-related protein n=1 Tax=Podospora appendiculata TaxID=314037 RepID=A0AAE0X3B1_9PEZI|nr:hypothetical protein B0T22DRAFT_266441 [Podospora appendiculata]
MKTAKAPASDGPSGSNRRAQPVRQTRINPPRISSVNRASSFPSGPVQDQPIEIFPAVTHFTDAITALPKELVRHFTLLKEVDAKIFGPEAALFQLIEAALNTPTPETNDASGSVPPASAPMSAQNSSAGINFNANRPGVPSSSDSVAFDPSNMPRRQLFRQAALKITEMLVSLEEKNHVISTARDALQKQLGRIEEIWPHLEGEFSEEAKWGSTTHWAYVENRPSKANDKQAERSRRDGAAALSAAAQQLAEEAAARSSDRKQALAAKKNSKAQPADAEADAKPQESARKPSGGSKSRKPAAEAATPVGLGISPAPASGPAPSKRRKVDPAKTSGGAPMERAMSSVFGNSAAKPKTASPRETPVPETTGKKRKALPTSSNQAKKSRTNLASPSVASSPVIGTFPDVVKTARASPVPPPTIPRPASSRARQNSTQSNGDLVRQRPASAASNKPNGAVLLPATPELGPQQTNGAKSNAETTTATTTAAAAKTQKEPAAPTTAPAAPEPVVKPAEPELPPPPPADPVPNGGSTVSSSSSTSNIKKEAPVKAPAPPAVVEEREHPPQPPPPPPPPQPQAPAQTPAQPKSHSATPILPPTPLMTVTTTKSGRASKPSTPALATFAEAASRSRPTRNAEGSGNNSSTAATTTTTSTKRSHKKGASISAAAAALATAAQQQQQQQQQTVSPIDGGSSSSGGVKKEKPAQSQQGQGQQRGQQGQQIQNQNQNQHDDDDDVDVDEQRYCLCNGVSYGEMVACDGDGCPREWFHLECVGLKVAPKGNAKWYCEECKKRLQRR